MLEFAILTAAQSCEVSSVVWSEIDLDAAIWTMSTARVKPGGEHCMPRPTVALALLKAMLDIGNYIYLGQRGDARLSDMSLMSALRKMGRGDITAHGFRSTFRHLCAESIPNLLPQTVYKHALSHSLPDSVEAAYRRDDLIEKRKVLIQVWVDYWAKPSVSANMTTIQHNVASQFVSFINFRRIYLRLLLVKLGC